MAKPGKSVILILALLLLAAIISNTAIGSTSISPDITTKILVTEIINAALDITEKIFPSATANILMANPFIEKTGLTARRSLSAISAFPGYSSQPWWVQP